MRIGIMSFEESLNNKTLRGVSTTTRYLQQDLINVGFEVDLLIYGKGKLDYPEGFDIAKHFHTLDELEYLRDYYDFMIYYTPGRSLERWDSKGIGKYQALLDTVDIPFTYIYHSEEYEKHQPYRHEFLNHPDCKFLVFVAEGFQELYADDLTIVDKYIVMNSFPPLNSLEYIKGAQKSESVIITSAWTNFKRNLEYFELVDKFLELGITPYSAGAPNSNFYVNDILDLLISQIDIVQDDAEIDEKSLAKYRDYTRMMSRIGQDAPYTKDEESNMRRVIGAYLYNKSGNKWFDYGYYYPEDMTEILRDKKFHWNISCYKVNHRNYFPRFETVTIEAFNEGCLPVICKETTPDWVPDDTAIRLSKSDYADHVDILANMSEEERISRIEKFYDLLKTRIYDTMFVKFRSLVEEVLDMEVSDERE